MTTPTHGGNPPADPDPDADPGGRSVAGPLTLAEATALLDWLEQRGVEAERVEVGPDGRVKVWWRT